MIVLIFWFTLVLEHTPAIMPSKSQRHHQQCQNRKSRNVDTCSEAGGILGSLERDKDVAGDKVGAVTDAQLHGARDGLLRMTS